MLYKKVYPKECETNFTVMKKNIFENFHHFNLSQKHHLIWCGYQKRENNEMHTISQIPKIATCNILAI